MPAIAVSSRSNTLETAMSRVDSLPAPFGDTEHVRFDGYDDYSDSVYVDCPYDDYQDYDDSSTEDD